MALPYEDRADAGRQLAARLAQRAAEPAYVRPVVLGLPRGGVPVAAPVAQALGAPLDVAVVRKLGAPRQPELAVGAVGAGVRVLNDDVVQAVGLDAAQLERITASELAEVQRREELYRGGRPAVPLAGRTAVLVDDGLATGATMLAAVRLVQAARAARVVVAVPVGAPGSCRRLAQVADEVVCLAEPEPFRAVGMHYRDFDQTLDEEVRRLVDSARLGAPGRPADDPFPR